MIIQASRPEFSFNFPRLRFPVDRFDRFSIDLTPSQKCLLCERAEDCVTHDRTAAAARWSLETAHNSQRTTRAGVRKKLQEYIIFDVRIYNAAASDLAVSDISA